MILDDKAPAKILAEQLAADRRHLARVIAAGGFTTPAHIADLALQLAIDDLVAERGRRAVRLWLLQTASALEDS